MSAGNPTITINNVALTLDEATELQAWLSMPAADNFKRMLVDVRNSGSDLWDNFTRERVDEALVISGQRELARELLNLPNEIKAKISEVRQED